MRSNVAFEIGDGAEIGRIDIQRLPLLGGGSGDGLLNGLRFSRTRLALQRDERVCVELAQREGRRAEIRCCGRGRGILDEAASADVDRRSTRHPETFPRIEGHG